MTYPNQTEEEFQKLRNAIDNTLDNMKSDIRKKQLKVFGKTLLLSPIVLAALGGAAMLIAGNNGVLGRVKNIREKSKERKSKEEVKNLDIEQVTANGRRTCKISLTKIHLHHYIQS